MRPQSESPWLESRFGEVVAHSAFGPRFSGDLYAEDGNIATLRTTDISEDGRISYPTMPRAAVDDNRFSDHLLKPGDLVIRRSGRVGTAAVFDGFSIPVLPGAFLIRFRLTSAANPRFFCYYFNSRAGQQKLRSVAKGAAQQNLTATSVLNLAVPLPPARQQDAIVSALSRYDDLVENNRRRIELLQRSAHLLFKEWFVHLRYPGREHDEVVAGVPAGWTREALRNLCSSVDYGYTASAETETVGPHFLRITDIVGRYIEWASVPYCRIDDRKLKKFKLDKGDVVVARTGATVGYAKRINKGHPQAVFASYLVRLKPRSLALGVLMGVFMENDLYKQYVAANVGGAAQPNANAQVLSNAIILVPSDGLLQGFRSVVEPIFDQIEVLTAQIEHLKLARDLLLPRLMDGRISV